MQELLLVVDNDTEKLTLVTDICRANLPEVRVVTATTGSEGLQLAQAENPGVVVVAMKLPDLDGFEVCRRLKAKPVTNPSRVLMISNVLMDSRDRTQGLECGAEAFISKPFDQRELVLQIKNLIRQWTAERNQRDNLEAQTAQYTMAGRIAHDFNNSMTTIIGYTELLIEQLKENPALVADLTTIQREGQRAKELTHQLFAFSQPHPLARTTQNPAPLITTMAKTFQALAGSTIEVKLDLAAELHSINVDPHQFRRILMELVQNAHTAMPQGGQLTIQAENIQVSAAEARLLPKAQAGDFVRVSVADTGQGTRLEAMDQVFEPVSSIKEPSAGLVLPAVDGVMKQHQGWMRVNSRSGIGSTFHLYFPAVLAAPEKPKPALAATTELRGHSERILLVEDEASVRQMAVRFLQAKGYEVLGVASAEEALDVFRQESGRFDLVFSDIVLPGRTGIELVFELVARKPDLRVILSSAYTDEQTRWPIIKERGFRFFQKTDPLDELLQTVHEELATILKTSA